MSGYEQDQKDEKEGAPRVIVGDARLGFRA